MPLNGSKRQQQLQSASGQAKAVRYAFVATGELAKNASFVRLRELGRCLAERGIGVHYCIDDTLENRYRVVPGLSFAGVHFAKGRNRLSRLFRRRRLLADLQPAAIHILNPQPSNCATVVGLGIPVVCDWDELLSSRKRRLFQRRLDRASEGFARRHAQLTVVASRSLQATMKEKYGLASLYVPYATYLPEFEDGPNPYPRPTAVYLGNLRSDFDHDLIIDAWDILQQRDTKLDLCILGGGPLLERVRSEVKERRLSSVRLPGYMAGQELWDHLRHAHVLLFPIRDSPGNRFRCPSKTFAYMQARRPIITNQLGEVAEALGLLARYVEPTPRGFADAVELLAGDRPQDIDFPLAGNSWDARAAVLVRGLVEAGILNAEQLS